jgi:hypothetical protein
MTPKVIRDRLATHITAEDQLLVADITGASIEWAGLNKAGAAWLQNAVSLDAVPS